MLSENQVSKLFFTEYHCWSGNSRKGDTKRRRAIEKYLKANPLNILGYKDGVPIIACRLDKPKRGRRVGREVRTMSFFCPFCVRRHTHGYSEGVTHRVSHCWRQDSPLSDGYYVQCVA